MDFEKDYYSILGVLPTAELVVIKAAYKAMLKVYHPDKFEGLKDVAHRKTTEINSAYSILSNTDKRKQYDDHRTKNGFSKHSYQDEYSTESGVNSKNTSLDTDWEIATKYQPSLIGIVDKLTKLSSKLAFTYKAVMIESKEFGEQVKIANKMEQEYLNLYFGSNKDIQLFAKELIIGRYTEASKELNKAIGVFGKGMDVHILINKIRKEFDIAEPQRSKEEAESEGEFIVLLCLVIFFLFFVAIVSMST